jgi:hypothetical protein
MKDVYLLMDSYYENDLKKRKKPQLIKEHIVEVIDLDL